MTRTMKSCFVTLAILFVWRVEEGAEACTCLNITPEQKICNSDVVLKARVTGSEEVTENGEDYIKFDINAIKVFQGPLDVDAVYTSGPCRALLNTNRRIVYLITGRLEADGKVQITLCNFIQFWQDLSVSQLRTVQNYKHYCS